MNRRAGTTLLLLGALALWTTPAAAHELQQSYLYLRIYEDAVEGRLETNLEDVNLSLGLELPTDESATLGQIEPHVAQLHEFWFPRIGFAVDDQAVSLRWTETSLKTQGEQYVALGFVLDGLATVPDALDIRFDAIHDLDPDHQGMVLIEHNWRAGILNNEANVSLRYGSGSGVQTLDLTTKGVWRGMKLLIGQGVHHIWIGIDHILFLLALLLPAVLYRSGGRWEATPRFRSSLLQVVKIVTLFTIAHSVTLSVAALGYVNLAPRLVESIIALSIAIAAAGILLPGSTRHLWWVVIAFGLFHGFGFAYVLGEMGIQGTNMALSLLGFNLGVELGQLAIVCVAFPALFLISRVRLYPRLLVHVGSLMLIAVSLYWFIERAFEVDLPAGAYWNRFRDWLA